MEEWSGKNKVYLGGRIVHGYNRWSFYFASFLMIPACILFTLFVSTDLWGKYNPIIFFLGIYLHLIMLTCFYFTAYTDPGIIPRNIKWKELSANEPKK